MTLQYISSDKSINLTLNYIRTRTLKMYPGVGKTFPLTTQCVIIDNKNGGHYYLPDGKYSSSNARTCQDCGHQII